MTTIDDLKDAPVRHFDGRAGFARTSAEQAARTNDLLQRYMTALQTVQTVRKSSETTVQLSLSDEQYTVSETGAPVGAASRTNATTWMLGIDHTYIRLMKGKLSAEHDAKVRMM